MDREQEVQDRAADLARRYAGLSGTALLEPLLRREFPGRIAVVSSFGAEAAVLLHLIAEINPATPVVFLDTGKHFTQTLRYRDALTRRLGLTDLRVIQPETAELQQLDPRGTLYRVDPDLCCRLRKVLPLRRALAGFDAWINGRKRFQGGDRAALTTIEAVDGRIKINPLAHWSAERIAAEFAARDLPRHPLVAQGYSSIGCAPCTRPTTASQAPRAGRWAASGKTECGIHWPTDGA
ncbi:MAG TPA: phosphoadenylyl-sulfate reductase [Kiloniellales bacterium]